MCCRRSKYTEDDDKAILCGLLDEERFKVPGGNKVWRELEQLKVFYIALRRLPTCSTLISVHLCTNGAVISDTQCCFTASEVMSLWR